MSDRTPERPYRDEPYEWLDESADDIRGTHPGSHAKAKSELRWREREYAADIEADRRRWETEREQSRRTFEMEMFNAAGDRAVKQERSRQAFEASLADKHLQAAADVAWATKLAMIAAGAAALGAIVQAAIAVASFFKH